MSPSEAVLLLRRIVGADRMDREPAAVRELTRLCCYLPLALRIAGARLAARSHWSVGDLAHRLTDGPGLLTELAHGALTVRSCFEPAYRRLTKEDRRLFRMMGLCGAGTYAGFVGTTLLGRSGPEAVDVLERLTDARLLSFVCPNRQGDVTMFRLHGLAAAYARERADFESSDSERAAAAGLRCRQTEPPHWLPRLRAVRATQRPNPPPRGPGIGHGSADRVVRRQPCRPQRPGVPHAPRKSRTALGACLPGPCAPRSPYP